MVVKEKLRMEDLIKVSRRREKVFLSSESIRRIEKCHAFVEALGKIKKPIYGINTGFGYLAERSIPKKDVKRLQENLVKSHAVGSGGFLSEDIVRGAMFLRIHTLSKGYSGIRRETAELLINFLNKGITPLVYEKGSVGASGDLAPLSFIALSLLGKWKVWYKGRVRETMDVMKEENLTPVSLGPKEGLALINGTQMSTSILAHAVYDAEKILDAADEASILSFVALLGDKDVFNERIAELKPLNGIKYTAKKFYRILEKIKYKKAKVQDSYSLRCIPQVHGSIREFLRFIKEIVEKELNSVTDNPLLFPEEKRVLHGGNFHGASLGYAADLLSVIMTDLSSISERRIAKLIDPERNNKLPAFLIKDAGVNSGFMIPQVMAASLVSLNKTLSHPSSVDSIPTSADQEDHVSMSYNACLSLLKVIENTATVVAIEQIAGAQALELRFGKKIPHPIKEIFLKIRENVDFLEKDREITEDINKIKKLILK